MNKKLWQRGLQIAALTGLLSGLVCILLQPNFTWRLLIVTVLWNVAKDCLLYIRNPTKMQELIPYDTDTEHLRKILSERYAAGGNNPAKGVESHGDLGGKHDA